MKYDKRSAQRAARADALPAEAPKPARLNPEVLKLGLVSFLTDLSSEAIFSVFAVFFTTVAGASSALLGLVEGLADFSAPGATPRPAAPMPSHAKPLFTSASGWP